MYAEDSQLYIDFRSCDEKTAITNLQLCTQEMRTWMQDSILLLKKQKTKIVNFGKKITEEQSQTGDAANPNTYPVQTTAAST